MMGMTVSGHRPSKDPEHISDTREKVMQYMGKQLYHLYEKLSEIDFFDNGILIITGDHRAMFPAFKGEREKYPDTYIKTIKHGEKIFKFPRPMDKQGLIVGIYSGTCGSIYLKKGLHPLIVRYFDAGGGGSGIRLAWKKPEQDWKTISPDFFRLPQIE